MKYELQNRKQFIKRPLVLATLIIAGLLLVPALYHYNYKAQTRGKSTCSEGWYITGYYIPREDELHGDGVEINVERVGNLTFSQEFLNETRTEGWGITRFGWSLGYYSGAWHRSDRGPLDASGNLLTEGAIAIDRSLIPSGAEVQISTLPSPWSSKTFRATDIGVGIEGQHIDVFTGMGRAAEQETFRITSNNNRVCFTSTGDASRDGD